MSGDHQMGEGAGKGKRELSTSKRAAQNRAAQVSAAARILGIEIRPQNRFAISTARLAAIY